MSDTTPTKTSGKAGGGWSDKERLVYIFALIDQTGVKPDFKNTPRPANRTEIACQRMFDRLKNTLKDELAALKDGNYTGETATTLTAATPKKPANKRKTPSKDKDGQAQAGGDADGSPKKRGRKKKVAAEATNEDGVGNGEDVGDGGNEELTVKSEAKYEMMI